MFFKRGMRACIIETATVRELLISGGVEVHLNALIRAKRAARHHTHVDSSLL